MEIDAKQQINSSALKWLYEMEALQSPVLRQNLYENVFVAHRGIHDCKIFITPPQTGQKGILIWLKLGFWTKLVHKDEVYALVEQIVNTLLPSFRVRVVADESLLKLAEKRADEIYGGKSEASKESNTTDVPDNGDVSDEQSINEPEVPKTPDILPDPEKQAEAIEEVCNEIEQLDLPIDEKAPSSS